MKKLIFFLGCIVLLFSPTFVQAEECKEEWVCTDWSKCKEELKTRTCEDKNDCGTDLYKPFESTPCSEGEAELTNTFTGLSKDMIVISILSVVLIVGASGIFLYKKRKK